VQAEGAEIGAVTSAAPEHPAFDTQRNSVTEFPAPLQIAMVEVD